MALKCLATSQPGSVSIQGYLAHKWEFRTQRFEAKGVSCYKNNVIPHGKSSNSQHFWRVSRVGINFARRWCSKMGLKEARRTDRYLLAGAVAVLAASLPLMVNFLMVKASDPLLRSQQVPLREKGLGVMV